MVQVMPDCLWGGKNDSMDGFRDCGGYMVANGHSHIRTVKGENIVAMCEAAQNANR